MSMVINPFWGAPAGYVESGYFGSIRDGGTDAANPSEDLKYGNKITSPVGGVWVKHMFMSFHNGVTGAVMRPVLYSGSGVSTDPLFYQGEEFTCPSTFSVVTTELGPMPWQASGDAIFLPAGDYVMGMMFGAPGMTIRAAESDPGPLLRTADGYSNGAAPTYGSIASFTAFMLMRMPYSIGGP